MRLQTNKNCNTSSLNLTGDFDEVVKGNIKITHNSNGNSNDYIIKFKKVGLFLVYQTWSNDNEDVNKNRKVALVNSKKWVELFNNSNSNSNSDDSFTFTPTTVMEIKNKKYLFVINEAFFNEKDKLIFKVSTNEIKLSTGMNEKLKIIPLGCHENVRFDIDSLSSSESGIKAIVITCIDFRLIDDAVTYLNGKGFENQYDEFILAGGSLGYNTSLSTLNYSGWTAVLDDHINISYSLHKIKDVIVMDHMDCGAYKAQYGASTLSSSYVETKYHIQNLNIFRTAINKKYVDPEKNKPKFNVQTWLMSLDGSVDQMPTYWQPDSTTFTLSQNNVVIIGSGTLPSSLTSIGSLPSPTTTSTTPLKYKLLNDDGSEITITDSNYIFASVNSYSDDDGNIIWYIQNLQTGTNFYENLSSYDNNPWVSIFKYRVQVIGVKAYVNLKMTVMASTSDSTTILPTISFEFTSANY
jgi:hypothetical protein